MPLFKRSDGVLIKDLSRVRQMMPFIMKGRNESVVYHEQTYDVSESLAWLRAFNESREHKPAATMFHLYLWACAQATHERPGLNRFVSGGRIYQRKAVEITFAAKKTFDLESPLVTVKVPFPKEEAFADTVDRILSLTGEGRRGADAAGKERQVDKEVRLLTKLPPFALRLLTWVFRSLDRVNLAPASMIKTDPMYASIFIANLGSVGLDNTYHHLYEYGTVPLFGVVGTVKKHQFIDPNGKASIRDAVQVRWSFDERVNDGFYCAAALTRVKDYFEDPARFLPALPKQNGTKARGKAGARADA